MLVECNECGGKVSTQAKHCPHCGNPKFFKKPNPADTTEFPDSVPLCYFCKNNRAVDRASFVEQKMYFVQKRTGFPLGYKYLERKVKVPRCTECCGKHDKIGCAALLISAPFGYGLVSWGIYHINGKSVYAEDGSWFGFAIMVFLFGSIAAAGLTWVLSELSAKRSGIPPEHAIENHPEIEKLKHQGWLTSKPDPASHPETGEERRKNR